MRQGRTKIAQPQPRPFLVLVLQIKLVDQSGEDVLYQRTLQTLRSLEVLAVYLRKQICLRAKRFKCRRRRHLECLGLWCVEKRGVRPVCTQEPSHTRRAKEGVVPVG